MKDNAIKGAVAAIFAGAAAYFHLLLGPVFVLIAVMITDYASGIGAAWVTGTLSSRTGAIGIIKKIGYIVAVGVAVVVDYVIHTAGAGTGMDLGSFHIFGLLVTVWLILNECISILENLDEIGVPLPGFLVAIIKRLKKSAEKTGEAQTVETDRPPELPAAGETGPGDDGPEA